MNDIWVPIIVFAVILGILFFLGTRKDHNRLSSPPEVNWEAANDPRIRELLDQGKKIQAIKIYRELTGAGLKEAKDAVEYAQAHPEEAITGKKKAAYDAQDAGIRDLIQEGRIDEAIEVYRKFAGVDEYTAMDAIAGLEDEIRQGEDKTLPQDNLIHDLLRQGKKIEAIKLYRERTGLGLKEAKDAVEAMQRVRK